MAEVSSMTWTDQEALAKFLHDEIHDGPVTWTWPEHEGDDGYRGSGWVHITPQDVQERNRDEARRILAFLENRRQTKTLTEQQATALHWILVGAVELSLGQDLDPIDHSKEARDLLSLIELIEPHGYNMKAQRDALEPFVKKGEEAAKSPEQKLRDLLGRIERSAEAMDGDAHGNGSRPPDGDDWNDLYADVVGTLKDVLKLEEK